MSDIAFSVFTKPWHCDLNQLGARMAELGFTHVEFPVRPDYPVTPETVDQLPAAARTLAKFGVTIHSVAGPTDEATIRACGEAGVPIIRTMARVPQGANYVECVQSLRDEYTALLPLLEECSVTIGVQNHCNRFVANALGLQQLLDGFDPRHVAAVWDAAHEALNGVDPDMALDVIWPQLCLVNLKNGYWQRMTGPEAEESQWRSYWTAGHLGLCSWPTVAEELIKRGYKGVICLTAEYSDHDSVDRLIAADLAYARSLFSA